MKKRSHYLGEGNARRIKPSRGAIVVARNKTANTKPKTATTKSASQSFTKTGRRRYPWRASADPAQMSDISRLRFEATVNGRYHAARQGWYEFMHKICMFVVVIGGTGAVAEAAGSGFAHSWLVAIIPTFAGTLDLVFDFAGKAALHARLQERSYDIIADLESTSDNAEIICRRGWAMLARICAQETKLMRVVHALAYNDTKEGTADGVADELLVIPAGAKFWKHIRSYPDLSIRRASEITKTA